MGTGGHKRVAPPNREGFDFTLAMRGVCEDLVSRLPALQHIRMQAVAISFAQARNRSSYGTHATLTPMRFEGGSMFTERDGRQYTVRRIFDRSGCEILYILTFFMPRFMDVEFVEKVSTVVHELWHISPDFNGDIRRFPGRCYAHSGSQKEYDAAMDKMALEWLDKEPPVELYEFLQYRFDDLAAPHRASLRCEDSTPQANSMRMKKSIGPFRTRQLTCLGLTSARCSIIRSGCASHGNVGR